MADEIVVYVTPPEEIHVDVSPPEVVDVAITPTPELNVTVNTPSVTTVNLSVPEEITVVSVSDNFTVIASALSASYAGESLSSSFASTASLAQQYFGSVVSASYAISASHYDIPSTYTTDVELGGVSSSLEQHIITVNDALTTASGSIVSDYVREDELSTKTVLSSSFASSASYWSGSIAYSTNALSASYWSGSIAYAESALSSSYATTASYALNGGGSSESSSYASTASYAIRAETLLGTIDSASYAVTASYAVNGGGTSESSSYADTALSASYATTASYALNGGGSSESASYAETASYAAIAQTLLGSIESAATSSYVENLLDDVRIVSANDMVLITDSDGDPKIINIGADGNISLGGSVGFPANVYNTLHNQRFFFSLGDGQPHVIAVSDSGLQFQNQTDTKLVGIGGSGDVDIVGNLGIGVEAPSAKLEIAGGDLLIGNNYFVKSKAVDTTIVNVLGLNDADNVMVGENAKTLAISFNVAGENGIDVMNVTDGSVTVNGSLTVTDSIIGSMESASYAETASYAVNGGSLFGLPPHDATTTSYSASGDLDQVNYYSGGVGGTLVGIVGMMYSGSDFYGAVRLL